MLDFDRCCDSFEAALRRGEKPRIEDFLNRCANVEPNEIRTELEAIESQFRQENPLPDDRPTRSLFDRVQSICQDF